MKHIRIIGGGPGDEAYILPMARQAVAESSLIIGDKRLLQTFGLEADETHIFEMGRMMERLEWLKNQPDSLSAGILVSGDPLMYSLFRLVRRTFPDAQVEIIPGIGSIQAFAARLGESMEDVKIISAHGRNMPGNMLVKEVFRSPKLFVLCDNERTPDWIAGQLIKAGLTSVDMAAGSRISYPDEVIVSGGPAAVFREKYPALSLVMIKNSEAADPVERFGACEAGNKDLTCDRAPLLGERAFLPGDAPFLLRDSAFLRNRTPMTREEVRWIALGKMGLLADSVVWDVGAGTGSVSLECARHCPAGKVIAIEKNPEALKILYQNREHLRAANMEIIEGTAPEALEGLQRPTHVFVGGAGRALSGILEKICRYGAGIRILIACVTLETMTEAYSLLDSMKGLRRREIVTIRIETDRPVGSYHLMEGGHPVTLVIAETWNKEEEY